MSKSKGISITEDATTPCRFLGGSASEARPVDMTSVARSLTSLVIYSWYLMEVKT